MQCSRHREISFTFWLVYGIFFGLSAHDRNRERSQPKGIRLTATRVTTFALTYKSERIRRDRLNQFARILLKLGHGLIAKLATPLLVEASLRQSVAESFYIRVIEGHSLAF